MATSTPLLRRVGQVVRSQTGLKALAALAFVGGVAMAAAPTQAQAAIEYPYCPMQGRHTGQSCTFTSMQQCRESIAANSGFCDRNPRYAAPVRAMRQHR
jgi:hypothetical protein